MKYVGGGSCLLESSVSSRVCWRHPVPTSVVIKEGITLCSQLFILEESELDYTIRLLLWCEVFTLLGLLTFWVSVSIQQPSVPLTIKGGTNRLSRNVGNELPVDVV